MPQSERQHWINVTFIQAGIMICVPSLMLGGLLIQGLSLRDTIIAGVLGYALATVIFTLQAVQGHDLGVPTIIAASSAFGKSACRIFFSIIFLISLIGWYALQADICGAAFSSILADITGVNIPIWISTVFWGIIMFGTAAYGIDGLKCLNYIAIPVLMFISLYGVYEIFAVKGIDLIANYKPSSEMTILQGIALTLSFMAVGAVLAADITRYQRNRVDTIKSTVFGIMPAGILMFIIGALLSIGTGSYDLVVFFSKFGFPFLGMLTLIFATWTTNTTNVYSAGLDFLMLFNLGDSNRARATIIVGIISTILGAIGIVNYFEFFLNILGYTFMPVAGVMIADYWILRKGKLSNWIPKPGFNIGAITAWGIGTCITVFLDVGFPIINGFFAAMIVFLISEKILFKKK